MVDQSSFKTLLDQIDSFKSFVKDEHLSPELEQSRVQYLKYLAEIENILRVIDTNSDNALLKIQAGLSGLSRYYDEFNWHSNLDFNRSCRKYLSEISEAKNRLML